MSIPSQNYPIMLNSGHMTLALTLFSQNPKNNGYNYADNNHRSYREVKTKAVFFYNNVSRQPSNRKFA